MDNTGTRSSFLLIVINKTKIAKLKKKKQKRKIKRDAVDRSCAKLSRIEAFYEE